MWREAGKETVAASLFSLGRGAPAGCPLCQRQGSAPSCTASLGQAGSMRGSPLCGPGNRQLLFSCSSSPRPSLRPGCLVRGIPDGTLGHRSYGDRHVPRGSLWSGLGLCRGRFMQLLCRVLCRPLCSPLVTSLVVTESPASGGTCIVPSREPALRLPSSSLPSRWLPSPLLPGEFPVAGRAGLGQLPLARQREG